MKTVLLTGDSKGVGVEILKILLESNEYKVIGLSRTFSEENKIIQQGFRDQYIHFDFDLQDVNSIKDLYLNKLKGEGPIYGFVNNAAIAYDDIVTNLNLSNLEKMYRVNVFAPMMIVKYVLRDMLLHKVKGSIVHISSISAHTGYKGLAMYASTKGSLEAFSKNVAREWGGLGIRSNVVCPGFMETEMSSTLSQEQKDRIYRRTALKEATSINSVANTVRFLLNESAYSITGQVIHVDNGTI